MKRITTLIFILSIIASSCRIRYNYQKFDFDNGPNPCENTFKDRVFISILIKCYDGTDTMKEIKKRDAGNPYEDFPTGMQGKIDSVASEFVKRIPPAELCDECDNGRNYFMAQALHFYKSRDLDSITKVAFKNFSPAGPCGQIK